MMKAKCRVCGIKISDEQSTVGHGMCEICFSNDVVDEFEEDPIVCEICSKCVNYDEKEGCILGFCDQEECGEYAPKNPAESESISLMWTFNVVEEECG